MIDHTNTVVLLIGASDFPEDPTITPIPNVKANISRFKESLINPEIVGVPEANITISLNETKSQIERKLHDLAEKTRHKKYTLLVYYTGHGMLSSEDYELYLTTHYTHKKYLESDGINIEDFKKDIKRSAASQKIVLLDCCHSGAIIGTMNDTASTIQAEIKGFEGTYVMTSAAEDTPSLFPVDKPDQPTYFTGKLLEIINSGIESDCEYCSLREIYNKIEFDFRQAGLPRPQQSNFNTADQFFFSRNKKYEKPKSADEQAWEVAVRKNTKWAYLDFVKQFPESRLSDEAKLRIYQIEDKEYWLEASGKNTIFSLLEYLNNFSNGQFVEAANQKLEALRKKEEQEEEEQYWKQTLLVNNLTSFQNYLALYPDGRFAAKCQIQIESIKKEEAQKEADALRQKKQEELQAEQKRKAEQVQQLKQAADQLQQSGQYGEALELFKQILQIQPGHSPSLQAAKQCEKLIQKRKELEKEPSENQKEADLLKIKTRAIYGMAGLLALLAIFLIWKNYSTRSIATEAKKNNNLTIVKLNSGSSLLPDSINNNKDATSPPASLLHQADSLFAAKQYATALLLYTANNQNLQAEQIQRVAWIYENGTTNNASDINLLQAFRWYKKAAQAGNRGAMVKLANFYNKGIKGMLSPRKDSALFWFKSGAQLGDSLAMYTVGFMYHTGDGINKNKDSAAVWLQLAADRGIKKAKELLLTSTTPSSSLPNSTKLPNKALHLSNAKLTNTTKSPAKKIENLSSGPEDKADKLTLLRQADHYYVTRQYLAALNAYLKYPDNLSGEQCFRLGRIYQNGQGVSQNYPEALRWYQKAAEKGHALAMNDLGYMHKAGQGVTPNFTEAMAWYQKAAAKGEARAMNNMGFMYRNGLGVAHNDSVALNWYLKAAEKGDILAMKNLGNMYRDGIGVKKSKREAAKWYKKAGVK
ncbi:hypothetical protein AHMF7605_10750 [Adhaeribacter arboris]|uniref:Peptidase C14 caspase domain-containing protein n=1 Tax=Adhaeribacter arboris TaxID=2072846 RepID=A0A2T2YEP8_9BACT|nr:caspase family protein [Adhaeribacter arboris]PSR53963.1 hypothetical protein AHMF7605_10750 [Adhaeribacter arboris]